MFDVADVVRLCLKMADRWSIFSAAVKHCLEGWPALHIAQQQGFGGDNFKDKLDWLLEVIVQIFHDNGSLFFSHF